MLRIIRKSKITKAVSVFLIFNLLLEIFQPLAAFALTSGPSQPEVQSFQPVGITDMVDPFTGDYSYNIPLVDVGGYPINLIYNGGITMDQEASWVGLGWNINPGVITRNMRGIPDDFSGDKIEQEFNMEPNKTYGVSAGFGAEFFGSNILSLNYSLGVNYNNYNGIGFEQSLHPSVTAGKGGAEGGTASLGLNITANNNGLSLSPSLSYSNKIKEKSDGDVRMVGANVGVKINSRAGLQAITIGTSGGPSSPARNPLIKNLRDAMKVGTGKFELSGSSGGSAISMTPSTYVPQMDFPRLNTSVSFSLKLGGHLLGADGTFNLGGYYSENKLLKNKESLPAYGFMNEQYGNSLKKVMLDFNREKDGVFTRSTPNLPVTNHSYDVFSIAGQGIGGMFRPFRGDVGYVHDSYVNSISASGALSVELAIGNALHVGADVNLNAVTSHVGTWEKHNDAQKNLDFQLASVNDPYEPVYLKQAGEKTVDDDPDFLVNATTPNANCIGGYDPVRIKLDKGPGFNTTAKNEFVSPYSASTYTISSDGNDLKRYKGVSSGIKRVKRNMAISYLNSAEVGSYGISGYTSTNAKPHHIAEVSVLRTDGARYIYGIAAYNTIQKEVSFNVSGNLGADCSTGLVPYTSTDASSSNGKGKDHYFNKTTTPPYAHSYLLTSVLSADYSDVDVVRGPSLGDLGSYTKFNYKNSLGLPTNSSPTISNYKWRTPFPSSKASYNEGLKTIGDDNKGSYVYGEKDLWYLGNIETKTHVAIFHTSPRLDGFESDAETGSGVVGTRSMLKLDSISLYSRPDYARYANSAVPIKRVHFEYDYSLCQDLPNHSIPGANDGKLTLKKVYFTYQKSYRGKISPYEFTYADLKHDAGTTADANPAYNIKGYDRWGYYMPNNGGSNCDPTSGPLSAPDFPYVTQTQADADHYIGSWSLTDIKLPSGGKIQIDYEADDYAYVQDQNAMQMFKISGCGGANNADPQASDSDKLYDATSAPIVANQINNYLFFTLPSGVSTTQQVKDKLLRNMLTGQYMYFRFLMAMSGGQPTATNAEYVSGYAKITDAGVNPSYSGYGYVQLADLDGGEDGVNNPYNPIDDGNSYNQISKAAWNFCRIYNQKLAYGVNTAAPTKTSINDIMAELAQASIINQLVAFSKGPNSDMRSRGYGQYFEKEKSWVRLYNPNGKKLGGGIRVKELRIYDNWDLMNVDYSNNNNPNDFGFNYGQEYSYTLPDGTSSGVASYEPLPGGDENPFRQPVFFTEEHILAPDERNYQEEPYGESFFPAPGVGYSRVQIKNLTRANVTKHATGKTIHEFYTAKDFPTWTDRTGLDAIEQKTSGFGNIFNISKKNFMTASQGYVIELNDMHGKPKAQWVYAEGQNTPISGVEYKYKTMPDIKTINMTGFSGFNKNLNRTRLDNKVTVIHKNKVTTSHGTHEIIETKEVGVDVDFVTDFRESKTNSHSFALQGNMAAFLAAIVPISVPTILPSYTSDKTRFRSAVATKVINRYGILRETIAYDLGSQVSTENLAWDAETGEVLLTKTKNNFNDYVYNFTYPAHWGYDRMGAAYRNIGFVMSATVDFDAADKSKIIYSGNYYLVKGDEVAVSTTTASLGKAWVYDDDENPASGAVYLINKTGNPFNPTALSGTQTVFMKVIRSGRRNMQNLPIGTVTTLQNPIVDADSDNKPELTFEEGASGIDILNASMNEYSEKWGTYCSVPFPNDCVCAPNQAMIDQWNVMLSHLLDPCWGSGCPSCTCATNFCGGTYNIPIAYGPFPDSPPAGCPSYTLEIVPWSMVSPSTCTSVPTYSAMINGNCDPYQDCITSFTVIDPVTLQPTTLCSSGGSYSWANLKSLVITGVIPAASSTVCADQTYDAIATATFNPPGVAGCTASVRIHTCTSFGSCTSYACPDPLVGGVINPYVVGVRGDWRPLRTFAHQTNREQALVANGNYMNTSVRSDGKFTSYNNFWNVQSSGDWQADSTDWTFASEVKQYSPYGFEIENRDALGRYSGAIYGYSNTLPKAVASNAGQPDIAFEGFEDDDFESQSGCCGTNFSIINPSSAHIIRRTSEQAHTGRYSFLIPSTGSSTNTITTTALPTTTAACTPQADDMPYTIKECDLIQDFAPRVYGADRDFIVSFWVKVLQPNNERVFDYTSGNVIDTKVFLGGSEQTAVQTLKSDIIDGWQRIEERYTLHSTDPSIEISIVNNGSNGAYMDDIRVQPFNSSMKAFVYDPVSLRLWAELDERNFATIYEYDEDGALMRVKKETERGVMTIQESKNHTKQ